MLRLIFAAFFLLGVTFAANSANQYVDNVLQSSLRQELLSGNLLPAQLPDFRVLLSLTKYRKGQTEVDFTFGNVTGLDKIKRKGDCSGPRNYKGEISINCTLSLYPLQSAHRTLVRNSTYTSVGQVQAVITEVLVDLKIVGRPQNYLGLLKNFTVGNLNTLTPVFSNIPAYIRGDLPYLQKAYQTHVLGNLYGIFSQRYADAFRRAIAFKPMPRQ
ncbi:uncharacterized protein LOC129975836 isoform X2 [Argiope bruennichi]|uniref:Uncharacterized protein n=2 Tax=Argiope bruennichi TaxID=94029 RepID=A0A8T0ELW1_ARGBR|nr:uncharacterized protein LOC129975836 isoform X2 [Argiope bruennichi]KAF8776893.1 hypothetical protein HNY73_013831 [Argiope bruennichi]